MDKIYIFSNGTEAYDWIENNCRNCSQYGEDHESTNCPMAKEIDLGFIGADNFTNELIEPYGFKPLEPPARCTQFKNYQKARLRLGWLAINGIPGVFQRHKSISD